VCALLSGLLSLVALGQTQQRPEVPAPPDYQIALAGYTFDPLKAEPKIPPELRLVETPREPAYYILQFKKSLTREERVRVQARYGLRLTEYIAKFAYLEKVTPEQVERLRELDLFRWAGPYQPAFKLDPLIGKRTFVTEKRKAAPGLFLMVVLFRDANLDVVTRQAKEAGVEILKVLERGRPGGSRLLRVRATDRRQLWSLARLDGIQWIEEQGDITVDNATATAVIQSNTANQTPIYNQGIRGEGQIIGLIDLTLDMNHCFFQDALNNTVRPAHRKVVGYRQDNPATFSAAATCLLGHGTHTAGTVAGESLNLGNDGIAFNGRLTYSDLSDLTFAGGTRSFLEYLNAAKGDSARIHSNSWSDKSTTAYTVDSQDLDTFTWNNEDDLVVVSSGNNVDTNGDGVADAPSPTRPPWTSKNGLAVAASAQTPNQANVSTGGQGPTGDGRRKPEIYAPGAGINSAQAGTACGLQACSGSSMATPAIAGATALVRQYYTEGFYPTGTRQPHSSFVPSGALLKATLLNSTRDMNGNDAFGSAAPLNGYPSNLEGWGRLVLDDALFFAGDVRNLRVWDFRHADGLLTGENRQYTINVDTNTLPLKITLVWMEPPPAAANFANPVVNDLNLTVTSPGGAQTFLGNVFAGGVSTTGGAADALNNVEMVLVNAPAPGAWTITVTGQGVNVGNPAQGYALVATGDFTEPPPPTGAQDTLVVRVNFNDIFFTPSLPNLQNTMTDAVNYINEVSYAKTVVQPVYAGPFTLDHEKDYYSHPSRNLLIEMTQEVVNKLVAADPNVFTRGTANPADDIDRLILVTNDVNFTGDWATTGPWPYDIPGGFPRPLSVSIQSYANPLARFSHGLLHQFNLVDLYAHPGVVFPRAYVDEWDNMAGLFNNVHPLVWSKERATWINTPSSQITYIARPAAGGNTSQTIGLFRQESAATNNKAIAIGLTQGAATLAQERVFYFIEARDNALGGFDNGLPASGVLIYYVNELIPQGQGPAILLDKNPGTATLSDAAFAVGDSRMIPGTGITVTVQAGTAGADYNIQVQYTPPVTDYNVFITKGDTIGGQFYSYFSPDIWIDSPKNGYMPGGNPPPQLENPVVGMVNKLCGRITNNGPGTAFDFDVRFRVSEPYHTVGGQADFNQFVGIKHIASLGPNASTIVCAEWTPVNDGDPHSCAFVDLINLVGTDTNPNDNEAQENLQEVTSLTSSPYTTVTYPYSLTNPFDRAALFYFRAEGAPRDWSLVLTPQKALLNPGERVAGVATITPHPKAKVCTAERIQVTSWTPRGDTLIPVGGAVVQVDLRKPTELTLDTQLGPCRDEDFKRLYEEAKKEGRKVDPEKIRLSCTRIRARGCTNPPLPNQEIIVKYTDPHGNPVYHVVKTDANGCWEDFLVTVEEGVWQVEAEYEGDKCQGPTSTKPEQLCWCRRRPEQEK